MAVALDSNGSPVVSNSAVTGQTYNGLSVGSGTNRAMIFLLVSNGDETFTCTWDVATANQPMPLIVGTKSVSGTQSVSMYGLVAPASGAKLVTITWAGGATHDLVMCASSFTAVDQTGGATTFPNGTTAIGTSAAPSIAVTTSANNGSQALFMDLAQNFNSVDHTQVYLDNLGATTSSASNQNIPSGAASVTYGAVLAASAAWNACATDILAFAAAATAKGVTLPLMGVG